MRNPLRDITKWNLKGRIPKSKFNKGRVELKKYESRRRPQCPDKTQAFLMVKMIKYKKQNCDVKRERNNNYQQKLPFHPQLKSLWRNKTQNGKTDLRQAILDNKLKSNKFKRNIWNQWNIWHRIQRLMFLKLGVLEKMTT